MGTTNYGFEKPVKGALDWDTSLNSNMDAIDAAIADVSSEISDSPAVYVESGTFNYTTGDTITLPTAVDATNEYNVVITPTSRNGAIGDIWVEKTTTNFTVKCEENNTTDTFDATIYYLGSLNAYGQSYYRAWVVSPDASITDHGDDSVAGSLAWCIAQAGGNTVSIKLPGNHVYVLGQTINIPHPR